MTPNPSNDVRHAWRRLFTFDPAIDLWIGQGQQFLERAEFGLAQRSGLGIGETPQYQVQFFRAAMIGTVKRAFDPVFSRCHDLIMRRSELWMSTGQTPLIWPDDPWP